MSEFTKEQVEEMVRDAVEKTEHSFGGTFKRLKSENEELGKKYAAAAGEIESGKQAMEDTIRDLESRLETKTKRLSELAVKGELERQLREKGPLPERFIDPSRIEYTDDPEELGARVAREIEEGRNNLEATLQDLGIDLPDTQPAGMNPTNPPSRDTATAQDLKRAATQDALGDMMRRGLLR